MTPIRRASRRAQFVRRLGGPKTTSSRGDRYYKWSLRLTAVNVTDKVALYNFLSTFSGTHYVTPRALAAELGFHF